ncbi:MAG: hypothetical protein QOG00_830 [Pyrinomonadaceae bacterium]|nr:hypothetical protein [Pyrinomonadaceae bacterium]
MVNGDKPVFIHSPFTIYHSLLRIVDVRRLIETLAAREEAQRGMQFLAPCVGGGWVRVSLDGLVQRFRPEPHDFEGWGVLEAIDDRTARVVSEATLVQVEAYLKLLKPLPVRLAARLRGRTWLASPLNAEDARRQFDVTSDGLQVHLVSDGARFEVLTAYTDGCHWLGGELDRRADARVAERLRKLLWQGVAPRYITWKGITPETRAAYTLAAEFAPARGRGRKGRAADRLKQLEEARLGDALALGGGTLVDYEDEGDAHWRVAWQTSGGETHVSIVARRDLTIFDAGICLSGYDRDFDLQSLVGVVEHAWDD